MKKLVVFSFLFFLGLTGICQGNYPVWDKDDAWGGDDNDYLMDVHQNQDDYSITSAGYTFTSNNQDISQNNSGSSDYWVIQVDTGSVIQYENKFGGDSTDKLMVMVPTSDNGYLLAGSSASGRNGEKSESSKGGFDYWIVKIDQNGNKVWDRTIGGDEDDFLTCAIANGDGGYYLGGYSNSGLSGDKSQINLGNEDYWLVKIDGSGNVEWDLTLGGDTTDLMENITIGLDEIIVGGSSVSNATGTKTQDGYGGYDFWMNKVDFNGNIISDTTFGGSEDDFLEELRPKVHSPGYWVSGTSFSGVSGTKSSAYYDNGDVWVLKLDEEFNVELDGGFGSNNSEENKDLEIMPDGSAILASWSSGSGGNKTSGTNGGVDFWLLRIDTLGVVAWDENYGGALGDSLEAIFIKCDRGILAGGYSASGISGNRTHANKGDVDYWFFELSIPSVPFFNASNVCARTPLYFFDESDLWPDVWSWDFNDPFSANDTSADQHTIHTFSVPGVYNVSLTIKEGCQKDTTYVQPITVFENTVLGNVDIGGDFSVCGGDPIVVLNEADDAPDRVTYLWSTGDTTESILVDTMGVYSLTITDANCSATDELLVDTCPHFAIPNVFTPNEDDYNEVFKVKGIGFHEFDLMIFNRWGQLIYQSNNQEEGWDGTVNGNKCQIDVYVYKLVYRGLGLSQRQVVGRVALLR